MESTNRTDPGERAENWPPLPFEAWRDTCQTLHLWMQIVGKVRMQMSPFVNHWWHVPLYVTSRGLTTSPIPASGEQGRSFEVEFNFINHTLHILTSEGTTRTLPLIPQSVAAFYREFMTCLHDLGIEITINPLPCEVPNPIRCDEDEVHASYDPVYAQRFWRILVQVDTVLKRYRSHFLGKSSPIHFFWGSFDLALSRFSGRSAPQLPGVDRITQIAYSHEVLSCGFWPGNDSFPTPAFYSYTYPKPAGLGTASILPAAAFYSEELGEFLLRYDDMRVAPSPEQTLLDFFQSTYNVGATLAQWDRESLEESV